MEDRERISKIIESEQMTARQFAAEIGVSAGTISNILGGRNNASLEIMVKILQRFRSIDVEWLILGTGTMYRPNGGVSQTSLFGDMRPKDPEQPAHEEPAVQAVSQPKTGAVASAVVPKQVSRIIVFYTDGTYEER